ncbi:MAG TPA: permease-like cell division protein FtsX, partial [Coleofasciculaceae cyanobacterium]
YLQPGAQTAEVARAIGQLDGVVGVQTIPKDRAWQDLVRELGISDIARATQQLEGNPLTDELKAQAARADLTPQLAAQIAKIPGVDTARYAAEVVVRLRELDGGLKVVATGTIVLLVSAAIATIVTAIRLVVAARRQEIEIAQLVGATPVWIYLPFILQGAVFGVQGATIASVAVVALQQGLSSLLNSRLGLVQLLARDLPLTLPDLTLLLAILVGFGCSVGLLGSYVAVRRTTSDLALRGAEFEV